MFPDYLADAEPLTVWEGAFVFPPKRHQYTATDIEQRTPLTEISSPAVDEGSENVLHIFTLVHFFVFRSFSINTLGIKDSCKTISVRQQMGTCTRTSILNKVCRGGTDLHVTLSNTNTSKNRGTKMMEWMTEGYMWGGRQIQERGSKT